MATDIVLKVLKEFRGEMREFREETRKTLGSHSHRLNVLEATIASLKADMGTLLTTLPVIHERLDDLEARVAALESGRTP
jgi:BMFP domain-containing protein YqiC